MSNSKFSVRLERRGRYNFALYDIVVVKGRQKLGSRFYSKIGLYVPLYSDRFFFINLKELSFWLSRGAVVRGRLVKLISNLSKS